MDRPKYKLSLCLIIKDENEYLPEWINHHIKLGIDHFYIYDNNSEIPISETISKKIKYQDRNKITVIDWSGKHTHAQEEAYNHCLKVYGPETKWCGFIDTDEFIVINTDEKLADFIDKYEKYAGLYISWKLFNADGQVKKTNGPVMQRFKKSIIDVNNLGKLFVQTKYTNFMMIHEALYINNTTDPVILKTVNEKFEYVLTKSSVTTTDYIQCNHYITRSWDEWKYKIIQRGVPDPTFGRTLREFFVYNPDMKYLDNGTERRQEYEPLNNKK